MAEIKKRIKGLLYGCALGDAFGMSTEMLTRERIKESVGPVNTLIDSLPFSVISKNRKAGSITDDTLNTLMIFEMLKDSKGSIDVHLYIQKLIKWSESSPIAGFVTGPSTRKALELISEGVPISETGRTGTTNGAAMKIAPLGIVCDYREVDDLIEKVRVICEPTHNTSIAISGAAVIAAISSYVLRGGYQWDEIWELASHVAIKASYTGVQWPCASLIYRMKCGQEIAEQAANETEFLDRLYDEVGTGLETIETVPSALAIAYYAKGNPLYCAKLCAIIGGDTDTIGAIATAICGAMNPSIPQNMIDLISEENGINFDKYLENMDILLY